MYFPPEIIETKRLRLRRPQSTDAIAIFEYANDPEVTRYMDWPRSETIELIEQRLSTTGSLWNSGEEFCWIITLLEVDRAIGSVSLRMKGDAIDFGYLLSQKHWSKGLGTELSSAIVTFALSIPGVRKVWATCDFENARSARVLEKSGLVRESLLPRYAVRPNISADLRDALMFSKVK